MIAFLKSKNNSAFTLLEILVVIGIIAVLIGMGAASYSTAQKKARDAKRMEDLKVIQHALEQYYALCTNQYPFDGLSATVTLTSGTDLTCSGSKLITYPSDPLGDSYQCVGTCTSTSFMLCPPDISLKTGLASGTYTETSGCNSTNKNCCVTNQQ